MFVPMDAATADSTQQTESSGIALISAVSAAEQPQMAAASLLEVLSGLTTDVT
jgi:hypothetical protein